MWIPLFAVQNITQGNVLLELFEHSYQPMRLLHSSTQDLLTVPRCKNVFGGRQFSVAAP